MNIRIGFGILIFYVAALTIQAQDNEKNAGARFVLDFQTTADDTQTSSTVEETPVFEQVDVNGEARTRFSCTVVLQGAEDLTGVNCDLVFDPGVLNVVSIHEAQGDTNFDGRSNVADILALAQRFGLATNTGNGFSLFDFVTEGGSQNVIDSDDINELSQFINQSPIYWTSNDNNDLGVIRESVEIFEDPFISNANGKIDDIVVTLLRRPETPVDGFGFDGDARIADITFEVVGTIPADGTVIEFDDRLAIDEGTVITVNSIENASIPQGNSIVVMP